MRLKDNFYIVWTKDGFVLNNLETKERFLLDQDVFKKLADSDAGYNKDFQEAKITTEKEIQETPAWEFSSAVRIFQAHISVAENELDNAQYSEFWENYLAACEDTIKKANHEMHEYIKIIELPAHRKIQYDLYDALKKRRTIREFTGESVSLQELADILYITFGKFHESFGDKYLDSTDETSWRRSSPSAGGLNCVEPYILVTHVDGLENGAYFYDSKAHNLLFLKKHEYEKEFSRNFLNQDFATGSAFTILFVGNLLTVAAKYQHPRAFLFPYLDNGHLAQTALLTGVALNLKAWISAAFCDEYFVKNLNLKPYQIPVEAICFGHGYDESLGPKIRKQIEEVVKQKAALGAHIMAHEKEKVHVKFNVEEK